MKKHKHITKYGRAVNDGPHRWHFIDLRTVERHHVMMVAETLEEAEEAIGTWAAEGRLVWK